MRRGIHSCTLVCKKSERVVVTWQHRKAYRDRTAHNLERSLPAGGGSSSVLSTGMERLACVPSAGGTTLGKVAGGARWSNSIFSTTRFLIIRPPCRRRETSSSDTEEGMSSGGLLRLFPRRAGCCMMVRYKCRSAGNARADIESGNYRQQQMETRKFGEPRVKKSDNPKFNGGRSPS